MEEFIARLLDLQDIDRKIDRLKADLESIPREISIHKSDMQGHLEKFSVFNENLNGIKSKQKQLVVERAENVVRIADYKSRLVILKSNEEYTAMLKQITHTEKVNDQIDNKIIEAMYEEDEANQVLSSAQKDRDRALKRSELREKALEGKLQELQAKLKNLMDKRMTAAEKVDRKQLKMYDKSRSNGHKEVVTGIRNGACGGCLTKIPPQSSGDIRGGKTFTCPICGSYVVWTSDSSL